MCSFFSSKCWSKKITAYLLAKWWCHTVATGSCYCCYAPVLISFVLWLVWSWFKTGKVWTGRPGNGEIMTLSLCQRMQLTFSRILVYGSLLLEIREIVQMYICHISSCSLYFIVIHCPWKCIRAKWKLNIHNKIAEVCPIHVCAITEKETPSMTGWNLNIFYLPHWNQQSCFSVGNVRIYNWMCIFISSEQVYVVRTGCVQCRERILHDRFF